MILLCSVCFKGTDALMAGSLNAGILVLLGVTGAVLGCFAYFFMRLAQRARHASQAGSAPGIDGPLAAAPPPGSAP